MDYKTQLMDRIGTSARLIRTELQTMEPLFYLASLKAILPEFKEYVTVEAINQLDKTKNDILETYAFEFLCEQWRFDKAIEILNSNCVNYIEKAMAVSLGAATALDDDESPLGSMLIAMIGKCYYVLGLLGNPETREQSNMRTNLLIDGDLV